MRRGRMIDRGDSDVEHLGGFRPSKIRKKTGPDLDGRKQQVEIVIVRLIPRPKPRTKLSGAVDSWYSQEENSTEILRGRGSIGLTFMDPFTGRGRKITNY